MKVLQNVKEDGRWITKWMRNKENLENYKMDERNDYDSWLEWRKLRKQTMLSTVGNRKSN